MKIEQLGVSLADTPRVDARLCQDAGIAFGPDAQLQILPPQRDEILYTCDLSVSLPDLAGLSSARYLLWVANTACVARALVYLKRSMKA